MTSNQIAKQKANEEARANIAKERETNRANIEKEKLEKKEHKRKAWKDAGDFVTGIGKLFVGGLTGGKNDVSWYSKDPNLLNAAGNISYGKPLGSGLETFYRLGIGDDDHLDLKRGVPGLMTIDYIGTLPDSDIVDTAAKNVYAYVRHANSGHANYEANDLMMYLFAVCDMYSAVGHAQRIYSLLNTYKNSSFYYSKAYVESLGVDYKTFSENIANFRTKINTWIRRINTFNVPNTFPLFIRRMWLNTGIYKDSPIERSSNYIFCPVGFYKYSESTYSKLSLVRIKSDFNKTISLKTYDEFTQIIDEIIDAIFSSEDLGIMSGDILKAYGDGGLAKLKEIEPDFHIEAEYNAEVLSQINNATVMGYCDDVYCTIYTYNDGNQSVILQGSDQQPNTAPRFLLEEGLSRADISFVEESTPIINMYKDQVTPGDNMVASRLIATARNISFEYEGAYVYERELIHRGTEVVCSVSIVTQVDDGNGKSIPKVFSRFDGITQAFPTTSYETFEYVTQLMNFDWAPRLRVNLYSNANHTDINPMIDNLDICNYAVINATVLKNLHTVAALSLLNV